MFRFLLISLSIALVSCTKDPATFHLENLNNNEIGCFGHAGMGTESIYPINCLKSLESCLGRGADGAEMDVQITKDSVLIILHGWNLDENTTSCSGLIKDMNWSEMTDCKRKAKFFNDIKIITFDEFIEKLPNPEEVYITLDCKATYGNFDQSAYFKLFARTIVKSLNKHQLGPRIFIENLDPGFLLAIKDLKPDANLFLLTDNFDYGMETVKKWGFWGLSMSNPSVTAEQVKQAHDKNIHVTIWGVWTEKENYSAVEKCPDFIQTDDINYLLKIFGKYKKGNGYWYSLTSSN
ncbi:MAG: glycerophosphodiester phosphodiesterase family protein [Bacteroidia bacterium]